MRTRAPLIAALAAAVLAATLAAADDAPPAASPAVLARGKYLVAFGGCNDCHTPGWRESDGAVPESRWLIGSAVGFRGAWGTSYPTNVRLDFAAMSEDEWLNAVRTRGGHPPMVWYDVRVLTAADVHAIYAYVRHLGPAGAPAPAALPPWRNPATPFVDLRPQPPPPAGAAER